MMTVFRRVVIAGLLMLPLAAAGCDDAKSPTSPGTNPQILGVAPTALQPSAAPQVLTISGERFLSGLILEVRNPGGVTTPISGTNIQLSNSASFSASVLLDVAGTYTLTVRNSNNELSNSFLVVVRTITASTPTLTGVSPFGVPRSLQPTFLTFTGTNLGPFVTVTIVDAAGVVQNLPASAVTSATPTSLQVQLVMNTAGVYAFAVSNGQGEVSNYVYVTVS